jgi:hypothetical protein
MELGFDGPGCGRDSTDGSFGTRELMDHRSHGMMMTVMDP